MKVLWFSHFIPFPPRGGAPQRSFNLLRRVAQKHSVTVVAFNLLAEPADRLAKYREEFQSLCESVQFWEVPVRWKGPEWWLRLAFSSFSDRPFSPTVFWSAKLQAELSRLLRDLRPDLVHFDSIDLGVYAASVGGRRVLNHHNCESAMLERRAQMAQNPAAKVYLKGQAHRLARFEAELCRSFDVNLTVSAEDSQLLAQHSPGAHFHVVENGTDTSYFAPRPELTEPGSVVFSGSLNWYPNLSAIEFFRDRIWPLIKSRAPQTRFYLAGMKPPEWLRRWCDSDPQIVLTPDPEDIRPCIARGAVFICPITDGGGTRLKILDALAMGKAVVSTRVGCEGLRTVDGKHVLLADTAEEFAGAVMALLTDDRLRSALSTAGRDLVAGEYSWDFIATQLERAYACHGEAECGSSHAGSRPVTNAVTL